MNDNRKRRARTRARGIHFGNPPPQACARACRDTRTRKTARPRVASFSGLCVASGAGVSQHGVRGAGGGCRVRPCSVDGWPGHLAVPSPLPTKGRTRHPPQAPRAPGRKTTTANATRTPENETTRGRAVFRVRVCARFATYIGTRAPALKLLRGPPCAGNHHAGGGRVCATYSKGGRGVPISGSQPSRFQGTNEGDNVNKYPKLCAPSDSD